MNIHHFNACLLAGWLMLVLGLSLVSVPLALVAGGLVLIALTLVIAFRAGVGARRPDDERG